VIGNWYFFFVIPHYQFPLVLCYPGRIRY